VVRGDGDRDGRVHARQLLDRDRVRKRVGSGAAVLLGNRHPHQPELRELAHELVGKTVLAVELLRDRRDALDREVAHSSPDELVLFGEVVVRRQVRDRASSAISRTP
jgi:hypothetical protein